MRPIIHGNANLSLKCWLSCMGSNRFGLIIKYWLVVVWYISLFAIYYMYYLTFPFLNTNPIEIILVVMWQFYFISCTIWKIHLFAYFKISGILSIDMLW
jgi:hypothetical protein